MFRRKRFSFDADDFLPKLDSLGRYILLLFVFFLFFLLSVIPLQIGNMGQVRPLFLLVPVYFWSLFRPSFVPPLLVFIVGLMLDLLTGAALGLNAFLFVLVRMLSVMQRRFLARQGFLMVWVGFSFVSALAGLLEWLLMSFLNWTAYPAMASVIAVMLGIVLFPLCVLPLYALQRVMASGGKSAIA